MCSTTSSEPVVAAITQEAIDAIRRAQLTPIEHKILVAFVEAAESPELAGNEVLRRLRAGQDEGCSPEETLRALKDDWHEIVATVGREVPDPAHTPHARELVYRRDGHRCRLARPPDPPGRRYPLPPPPTFILPPSLGLCFKNNALRELLNAFMTPSGASQLRDMLLDPSDRGMLANTWLINPEASRSFCDAFFVVSPTVMRSWKEFDHSQGKQALKAKYHISRLYPEPGGDFKVNGTPFLAGELIYCFLETEDPQELPLPSPFLFQTHSNLARAFHDFRLERSINQGWPTRQEPPPLGPRTQLIARWLWLHLVPQSIRTWFYRILLDLGMARYRRQPLGMGQPLPFGLYAKPIPLWSLDNEPNALRLIEKHAPSIQAPRLIETFDAGPDLDGHARGRWLITTALPGIRAHSVLYRMSYPERERLADDLRRIFDQLARIPNTTPHLFANVSGGPIVDERVASRARGPYDSEDALNAQMAKPYEKDLRGTIPSAFSRAHRSVLAHGHLVMRKVLVDGGRLTGVVDWEDAHFMPEYWDCSKAMTGIGCDGDAQEVFGRVWGGRFEEELKVTRWLDRAHPFGGPDPD